MSIMVIITALLLLRQSQFDSSTLLRSLTYSVALSVRQAQVYGTSVLGTTTAPGVITYATAYGVYYDHATQGSYVLFADLHPGDYSSATIAAEALNTFSFSTGYSITEFCGLITGTPVTKDCSGSDDSLGSPSITSLAIIFKRPNFDASFVTYYNGAPTGRVYNGGYIRVQGGNGSGDYRSVSITSTGLIEVQPPNTAPGTVPLPQ